MELVIGRIVQGIGGALLMANAVAILTDAFPASQRGTAMGVNQVAGLAGMFIGLIAGACSPRSTGAGSSSPPSPWAYSGPYGPT
jgi:MFS family permease